MTARERISYLCDDDKYFCGNSALLRGYSECIRNTVAARLCTVSGIGYVSGRQCVIVANDRTIKAGAWFPITR